jgi:hypothetical protein
MSSDAPCFASVFGVRQVVAWKGGRLADQSRSDQGSESDRALERASRFFAQAKNAPCTYFASFLTPIRAIDIFLAKSGFV